MAIHVTKRMLTSEYLLAIVTFLSVISQTSISVESALVNGLTYPIWIIVFGVLLFRSNWKIRIDPIQIFGMVIAILILFMSLINNSYLSTRIFRQVLIAIFIFTVGELTGKLKIEKLLLNISRAYFIGALILSIDTYMVYLSNGSFIGGTGIYAYDSKNSSAQILLTALIMCFTIIVPNVKGKFPYYIAALIIAVVMLLMGSRATLVCIPCIVLILLFSSKFSIKVKCRVVASCFLLLLFLIANNEAVSLLKSLVTGNRDISDINVLSSGRTSEWIRFFESFPDHIFIGVGAYKIESFPLSVLYQYGLLAGIPILCLGCLPFLRCFSRRWRSSRGRGEWQCLMLLGVVYLVNGFFEELSPFGPGIKCFALWLMAGMLFASDWNTAAA